MKYIGVWEKKNPRYTNWCLKGIILIKERINTKRFFSYTVWILCIFLLANRPGVKVLSIGYVLAITGKWKRNKSKDNVLPNLYYKSI